MWKNLSTAFIGGVASASIFLGSLKFYANDLDKNSNYVSCNFQECNECEADKDYSVIYSRSELSSMFYKDQDNWIKKGINNNIPCKKEGNIRLMTWNIHGL